MANWALVVGIDRYAERRLSLKGAVRDALAMAAWLTGGPQPAVDPGRLHLLLSRGEASPEPPPGLPHREATLEKIVWAVRDLAGKAAGPDDRLYVHISCHGLSATGFLGGDAILPADFKTAVPTLALQIQGLLDYLKTSRFRLQFIFIDACRNVPFEGRFNVGPFPIAPDVTEMRPEVEQFVFAATSRGLKSNEDRSRANDERGVFTEALLRGLRGEGSAKRYNLLKRRYEVRPEDLLNFVVGEVRRRIAGLERKEVSGFFQIPTLRGERSSNPVLAAFGEDDIQPLKLTVGLRPPEAGTSARVRVLGAGVSSESGPPLDVPHVVTLKPRDYLIEAEVPGFDAEPVAVRLTRDAGVELVLVKAVALPLEAAPPTASGPAAREPARRGASPPARLGIPDASSRSASLRAFTWDPLVPIEVLDASGRRVGTGAGEVELRGAEPGAYTVRLRAPGGEAVEKLVFLKPGRNEEVHISPPPIPSEPALDAARASGQIDATGVNTLRVSERLGAPQVAMPEVTTLLAMALALNPAGEAAATAWRLRLLRETLLLPPPAPVGWGTVQVVIVDEFPGQDGSLLISGLSLGALDQAQVPASLALAPAAGLPGVAVASAALEAGTYWLNGRTAGGEGVQVCLPVMADRATNLILHRSSEGGVSGYAFLPPVAASAGDVLLQRRLELAQRFLHQGSVGTVLEVLTPRQHVQSETLGNQEELSLLEQGADPVAGLLTAYARLHSRETGADSANEAPKPTRTASHSVAVPFGGLCDTHVIRAAWARLDGNDITAARHCREALNRGLPLFFQGLLHLSKLVASLEVEHPRVEMLRKATARRAGSTVLGLWNATSAPI